MATDLNTTPNYQAVIDALLEKSFEGRIKWDSTADETKFHTAVKGERTFEVRYVTPMPIFKSFGKDDSFYQLIVRDKEGKVMFEVSSTNANGHLKSLYDVARRIANRVDEKIETTVEILSQL